MNWCIVRSLLRRIICSTLSSFKKLSGSCLGHLVIINCSKPLHIEQATSKTSVQLNSHHQPCWTPQKYQPFLSSWHIQPCSNTKQLLDEVFMISWIIKVVADDDWIVSHDALFQKHHTISQSWQNPSWNKVVFSSVFSLFLYFIIWHYFSNLQWLESEVSI